MRQDAKKIIKIASLSILFLFIIIYAFFRSKDLIFGVKIKNVNFIINGVSMKIGTKVPNNIVEVTGIAKNATDLFLDGREISVDQKGNFNETISLLLGYNVIDIKAQDKFGNIDEKNYKLMY